MSVHPPFARIQGECRAMHWPMLQLQARMGNVKEGLHRASAGAAADRLPIRRRCGGSARRNQEPNPLAISILFLMRYEGKDAGGRACALRPRRRRKRARSSRHLQGKRRDRHQGQSIDSPRSGHQRLSSRRRRCSRRDRSRRVHHPVRNEMHLHSSRGRCISICPARSKSDFRRGAPSISTGRDSLPVGAAPDRGGAPVLSRGAFWRTDVSA